MSAHTARVIAEAMASGSRRCACRRATILIFQPRERTNIGSGQQHLIFGEGDAVADVLVEQIGADQAECHFAQLVKSRPCRPPCVTDLCAEVVVAGRRSFGDGGEVLLSERMEQPHPRKPRVVPPVNSAADANGRDPGHVCAVGERGAHNVELVFNANKSIGDRHYVPLALEFAAPENCVCLRIDSLVELARAGTAYAGVITGVSGELPEYEAVEARVICGRLKPKRAGCTPQTHFERLRRFNLEIGIALVKGGRRIVRATGKQLGGLWCTLNILRRHDADEIPGKVLDKSHAGAHRCEVWQSWR